MSSYTYMTFIRDRLPDIMDSRINIPQHHRCSFGSKQPSGSPTDTAGSAGYQGSGSLELKIHDATSPIE
jgi:hypothetical protein